MTTIELAKIGLTLPARAALALAGVSLPSTARSLHKGEQDYARTYYGESLDYGLIYISDGHSSGGRAVTVALPTGRTSIVVLNLGFLHDTNTAEFTSESR